MARWVEFICFRHLYVKQALFDIKLDGKYQSWNKRRSNLFEIMF